MAKNSPVLAYSVYDHDCCVQVNYSGILRSRLGDGRFIVDWDDGSTVPIIIIIIIIKLFRVNSFAQIQKNETAIYLNLQQQQQQ